MIYCPARKFYEVCAIVLLNHLMYGQNNQKDFSMIFVSRILFRRNKHLVKTKIEKASRQRLYRVMLCTKH